MQDDNQGDGWLFKLSTTLGARHAHPAWPAATGPDAGPAPRRRLIAARDAIEGEPVPGGDTPADTAKD